MAFGDDPIDESLMAAWRTFCAQLEQAGERVFKDANPATPLHRADGFRYLAQNLGQAFDLALETRNTKFPLFHRFASPLCKLGADNADCIYIQAWIDGESVYRVTGTKGQARMWNFTVQGPRPASGGLHDPFGDTPEANILGNELVTDADGRFELFIGGERQGQNWLPTTPGSRKIFFRQFFDRFDEEPAQVTIERAGMNAPRPMPDPPELIAAMNWAGDFCFNAVDYWPDFLWKSPLIDSAAINRFAAANLSPPTTPLSPEDEEQERRRGRVVTQMHWRLNPDEALVVSFDAFDEFWMLTNEAIFGNSMDFLYRPVSYSQGRTPVDSDGRVRLVLAGRDPGLANWIDTQGFAEGVLNFRNGSTRFLPMIETETMALADVAQRLPDSPRMDETARTAQMLERFRAIKRRFAL